MTTEYQLSKDVLQTLMLDVARELFYLSPIESNMKMYNFGNRWNAYQFLYNDIDWDEDKPQLPIGPISLPDFYDYKLFVLIKSSGEIKEILKTIIPGLIELHSRLWVSLMFYQQTSESFDNQYHVDLLFVDDRYKQVLALHGGMTNYSGEGGAMLDLVTKTFGIFEALGIIPVEQLVLSKEAGIRYTEDIIDLQLT